MSYRNGSYIKMGYNFARNAMPMTNQLKFVHSADKLAEMRTKFHVIQAKLIMSVWCVTVQCHLLSISNDNGNEEL